ncbi:MAG: hypothetical protein KC657_24700 [Myxococcales bacterium]|nr:hypothetical protein [Myxococcales bacterium]
MRAKRAALLALVLLGPTACGRGCGCVEGETSYEKLDGKVKVELVRSTKWTGGRIPGPVSHFMVRVHTTPRFDEPVGCTKVDLAEDREGKFVAFRCKGAESWTVLRLRGGDRRLRECDAPVGDGRKPDFAQLGPVRDATSRLLACVSQGGLSASRVVEEIARSITEDDGDDVASRVVVDLAASTLEPADGGERDPWRAGFAALSDRGRELAHAGLCRGLAQPDVEPTRYARAAARCSHDGAAPNALAQFRRWFATSEPPADRGAAEEVRARRLRASALRWATWVAAEGAPEEAGKLACELGGGAPGEVSRTLAAMLVAHAQTKCPGVASWRRRPPCGDVDCDGGLCSAGEVRARIDGHLVRDALDDAGARAWPVPPSESLAVLGAWHAQGPLPRSITLPNARVHYALVSPDGGPRCTDELRRGTPCVCTAPQVGMACAFRDDETRGEYGGCQLHFDDARRRIDEITCACVEVSESCRAGKRCCGGLRCAADGGVCVPSRAPRAAGADADADGPDDDASDDAAAR